MFPKPDEFFKQSFEQWEKQTADYWNALLRDPGFLKGMWQSMETMLQARQEFNRAVGQTLTAWQLPTRENQEHILHQLNRLQLLVDDLNERVDDLITQVDARMG